MESTGGAIDAILGFDQAADRIDLLSDVGGIAALLGGTLNAASFEADLALAATGLGPGQALLLTADGGDLAGRIFLVIDADDTAGYQTGSDYVIELVAPAAPIAVGADFFV